MVEYVCKIEKGAKEAKPAWVVSVPGSSPPFLVILVSFVVNSLLLLARYRLPLGPRPSVLGPAFPPLDPRTSFPVP